MKKTIKQITYVIPALFILNGCSSSRTELPGVYELKEIREGESITTAQDIEELKDYGLYSWLEIEEDGTAVLNDFGEITAYTCDTKEKTLTNAEGGATVPYKQRGDRLILGSEEDQCTYVRVEDADAFLYEVTPHIPDSPWSSQTMRRTGSPDTGYYDVPERWFPVLNEEQKEMQIWTDGMYYRLSTAVISAEERSGWNDQSPEFALELYAHHITEDYAEQLVWKDYEQFDIGTYAVKECGMSFSDGSWMVIDVFADENGRIQYFVFESAGTDAGNHLNAFKEYTLNSFRTDA